MATRSLVPTFIMKTFEMLEVNFLILNSGSINCTYCFMDWIGVEFCSEKLKIIVVISSTTLLQT